jgi:hypothetical protein
MKPGLRAGEFDALEGELSQSGPRMQATRAERTQF